MQKSEYLFGIKSTSIREHCFFYVFLLVHTVAEKKKQSW